MSNCTHLSTDLTILYFGKLCLEGGVLLHLSGKESGYFSWNGTPKVLPNFLPPVDGSLDDYHHLPRRLVGSIYQTHQLLVLGLLWQSCCRRNFHSRQSFCLSFLLRQAVGSGRLLLSMSNCTNLSAGPIVLYFPKLCLARGVLLHVSGRSSGYFGWKGMPKVLPNFLPLVDGLLYDYHHLPRHLIKSI